jgi:hypothetical protein
MIALTGILTAPCEALVSAGLGVSRANPGFLGGRTHAPCRAESEQRDKHDFQDYHSHLLASLDRTAFGRQGLGPAQPLARYADPTPDTLAKLELNSRHG